VFSVGSKGLSTTPVYTQKTGESPVSMAIDSQGNYLAVADHGTGTGTGGGGVEIFQIGSGGALSQVASNSSLCTYPNQVVFSPPTDGTTAESLYIVCSSPEITSSSAAVIDDCTISQLQATSPSCTAIEPNATTSIFSMAIDPSNQYGVAAGQYRSGGFITEFQNPPVANSTTFPSTATFSSVVPSGQMAFVGPSSSENVLLGNYNVTNANLSSGSDTIQPCPVPSTSKTFSCATISTGSQTGPIALKTNPAGTALYVSMTGTAVSAGSSYQTPGAILAYSVSGTTLTSFTPVPTGGWPLSVSLAPNGNLAFVPNYGSSNVSVFSVAGNGALAPFNLNNGSNLLPVGSNPISVIVR
ncbi:MAG: beta-propeller fold lactonase family protein, partial [Leptospirillum sp.]